jgi:DnaK suppressor protein
MMEKDYKAIVLPPKYRPKKTEKYMSIEQRAYFYQMLIGIKATLESDVQGSVADVNLGERMNSLGAMDEGDATTLSIDTDLSIKMQERNMYALRKIEAALERLENGTYGYSVLSGDEIGLKRLTIRPTAKLTLEEQEEKEKR